MHALQVDALRLEANQKLNPQRKIELGQFMTPSCIAEFMSSLFSEPRKPVRLLDAGAGIGSLTIAAIKRLSEIESVDVWEIDPTMHHYLQENLEKLSVDFTAHYSDFIQDAAVALMHTKGRRYSHIILNPPYKKIGSDSTYRYILREVQIETVNLYTAFWALSILLAETGGEIVAIVPRSFCNGPYYKPFRDLLLRNCSIDHIHVFESRKKAFKDDAVLQENVIVKITKKKTQGKVKVSSSLDGSFTGYKEKLHSFDEIVNPRDQECFIHIPSPLSNGSESLAQLTHSLAELGIEVSTGPVVDFRLKNYWLKEPQINSAPLLYPHHFVDGNFVYPKDHKKPNALIHDPAITKWLMPNGFYPIIKRFSAKEERRRVTAYLHAPKNITSDWVGFENHWNVFHAKKRGLSEIFAKGLVCFLNSTQLDSYFRNFSGHTQVNATDLRNMRYPDSSKILWLGKRYSSNLPQEEIDQIVQQIL